MDESGTHISSEGLSRVGYATVALDFSSTAGQFAQA
jgi:hypothetical protein